MGRDFSKCHPKYEEKRSDKEPVRRHVFKGDLDGRLLPGVSRKFPEGTRKGGLLSDNGFSSMKRAFAML